MTYRDSYIEGLQLILSAEDSTPDQVLYALEKLTQIEMIDSEIMRGDGHNRRIIVLIETQNALLNRIAGALDGRQQTRPQDQEITAP